jgi:phosphonate transport system substrate-binding protein
VTFLAPNLLPVYEFITRVMEKKLGWPTELLVARSASDMNGHTDLSFLCGFMYVRLTQESGPVLEPLVAPVLKGKRYADLPIYLSDIIVRTESLFQTFPDLRGRSWSYNELDSQSGYGITRHHLLQLNETDGYFGEVIEAGWHERSIHMVLSGQVDASAIDSHVLAVAFRDDPELKTDLRIIGTFGPSTIQPVAAASRLSMGLKSELRYLLMELADDPEAKAVLAHSFIDRFVAIQDTDYDDIRHM